MFKRNDIRGTSIIDIKNINDNFKNIWLKVFGDINMSDVQKDIKDMLYTNWLQPQNEGNIDPTHPLYVRFYVPPTTNKIKSAKINVITSKYRVDSDVTSTSNKIQQSSVKTSGASSKLSADVDMWSDNGGGWRPAPTEPGDARYGIPIAHDFYDTAYTQTEGSSLTLQEFFQDPDGTNATYKLMRWIAGALNPWADLYDFQHQHNIEHTHDITIDIQIDGHSHDLNMGIKEATVVPQNVKLSIVNSNGEVDLGINLTGDNVAQNDIEIADKVKIGEWNIIKVSATNLSRVTVFGIIELLQKYY